MRIKRCDGYEVTIAAAVAASHERAHGDGELECLREQVYNLREALGHLVQTLVTSGVMTGHDLDEFLSDDFTVVED